VNTRLIAIIVIILAIAAAGILLASRETATQPTGTATPPSQTTAPPTPTITTTATKTTSATPTTTTRTATTTTQVTEQPAECKENIELVVLTRHPADIQEKAKDLFLKSDIAKRFCITNIRFLPIPAGFWPTYIEKQNIDVTWVVARLSSMTPT